MAVVKRFEDLECWRKARVLTREIYAASSDGAFAKDFGLKDQIRRASVSIMSNIAEGFDRGGNKEFVQFLSIAKGSAAEVQSQLYVALDAGHLESSGAEALSEKVEEVRRILSGFIRYLQDSDRKGPRFDRS
jgi:four helix bundle protein